MNRLNLEQYERLMIIAWKWAHTDSDDPLQVVDFGEDGEWEPVWNTNTDSDSKAAILRIDPCSADDGQYDKIASPVAIEASIDKINKILLQRKAPDLRTHVYLHTSQGYLEENKANIVDFSTKNGCRCKTFTFQHTDSVLYISPRSPLGLLAGGAGNWGEVKSGGKFWNAKIGHHLIAHEHFDFVWESYEALPKKRTYELYQNITRVLLPVILNKHKTKELLPQYSEQITEIQAFITAYVQAFSSDLRFADTCESVSVLYKSLEIGNIEDVNIALFDVRDKSINLLNQLPGDRIYV